MVVVDLIATGVLALPPFLVGLGVGLAVGRYRRLLLGLTGIPAIYFTVNLLIALTRQGLRETLLLGIPLGISPVFIMVLTAISAGLFFGLLAASWWQS